MVVALGWAYTVYGGLAWMQAVFYGVGASVIGIIAVSAYRLTRKTIGKDPLLWFIYIALFSITVATESEKVSAFLAAGLIAWFVKAGPKQFRPGTLAIAPLS